MNKGYFIQESINHKVRDEKRIDKNNIIRLFTCERLRYIVFKLYSSNPELSKLRKDSAILFLSYFDFTNNLALLPA